jgi:hypothetical protein
MIASSQVGGKLIFTKVQMGDGIIGEADEIQDFIALKQPKLDLTIQKSENKGNGQIEIVAVVDNSKLASGFFGRELGLFAKIGDLGEEKLYCYTNSGNEADYISADPIEDGTPYKDFIAIDAVIGSSQNVTVVVDESKIYVTEEMLNEKIDNHNFDPGAHANLIAAILAQVGNVGDIRFPAMSVKENELKLNGAELSRTAYATLWEWANVNNLVVSDAEWQGVDAEAGAQLKSGLFSSGDGTTTFRIPDHRGMYYSVLDEGRGIDADGASRTVGQMQGDTIRNIEGELHVAEERTDYNPSGAFRTTASYSARTYRSSGGGVAVSVFFDPSMIVPTGDRNRPINIGAFSTIRYK